MPIAKYKKEKHGNGYLYYTYEKTGLYKSDGKPEYKKLRAKTIAKLEEKVNEYKKNNAFGVEPSNLTVDAWQEQWFKAYKSSCRITTQNFYKALYKKHIKPSIGSMKLSQVREYNCQKILSDMSENYSEKTVASTRSVLFSIFDKAQANKFIFVNPAARLTAKGTAKVERRELTKEERKKYLAACQTHTFGTFAAILYFFGLRRGEALALTKSDLSLKEISINKQFVFPNNNAPQLSEPKTDAGYRKIPIPTACYKYIDFNAIENELLFSNKNGEPFSYSQITDKWKAFITYALGNDTDITMHCLRHNYCTMLFEAGVDLQTVKELMGHDDINTTLSVYTHYTKKIANKSVKKVLKIG